MIQFKLQKYQYYTNISFLLIINRNRVICPRFFFAKNVFSRTNFIKYDILI